MLSNLGHDAFPKYFSLLLFLEEKNVFYQPGFAFSTPHCCNNDSWHAQPIVCWELGQMLFVYLLIFLYFRLWSRTLIVFTFRQGISRHSDRVCLHQATPLVRGGENQNGVFLMPSAFRAVTLLCFHVGNRSVARNWK